LRKVKLNHIYHGDCLEVLRTFPEGVIDLTVTSPPYDNLRTYKGYDFNFEGIAKELYRVTKQGGVVVWVVGDATIKGSETGTSFRQALYFKDVCGFNLHDTMIFRKVNPIPQNHNRYEQCFEYMFVFSKGKPKTFNPLLVETKHGGKVFDWGDRKTVLDVNQARRHRESDERVVKRYKRRCNIFEYSVGGGNTGHPAVFPEQLAEDHILSWSNPGDIVLDPMCGSGTTCVMALKNHRHYIGIDIAEEYVELARRRVEEVE